MVLHEVEIQAKTLQEHSYDKGEGVQQGGGFVPSSVLRGSELEQVWFSVNGGVQKSVAHISEPMKRIAVSLYQYLEQPNSAGKVSFEQLVMKVVPGITKRDYLKFQEWIQEEKRVEERCIANYKDPRVENKEKAQKKDLNFNQIKDYLYIFTLLDKDNDGLLSIEDMKRSMGIVFSMSQIEAYFRKY
eukprot:CAMPEP_0202969586 /NCGR_PEP_ID=MMETSP1396-20130829/15384_1 /ASSEMBLY_ACC=CAM_ASM_000872 /TAXON_ID= /ORGANISM="Pseudokeronopsis sp., Strain Brazil" /LENGTH=186 /DNA_ID=CAMNT_0049697307 /DNA_START=44 /DNA_END=602 /DNA_ORIENTATION=+